MKPEKSKTIRLDKPVLVKTFSGDRYKGMVTVLEDDKIILGGKEVGIDNIMMISGIVHRNAKEKAAGVGLTIGAGIILVPAVYYILGGIAWGVPNGIFVGITLMVFDLFLAYLGTNLMGIYPRKFSTMNWNILPSPELDPVPVSIPLPQPSG